MSFIKDLENFVPAEGELAIWWLGQAGFMLKTHGGKKILIDPYLSDYVNRILEPTEGPVYRRMTPMWIDPEDLKPDVYLSSHEHPDHFDLDAIPAILNSCSCKIYTNCTAFEDGKKNGVPEDRMVVLNRGDNVDFGEFKLTVTDCDHGQGSPEALGFILDFGFTKVYYAGDTSLTEARLQVPMQMKPEIALLPINGAYGNLDADLAAQYAAKLDAKTCIPMHFWTFPEHDRAGGSPRDALKAFPEKAPDCDLYLAIPGETIVFTKGGKIKA